MTYEILIVEDEKDAADHLRAALVRYGIERGVDFHVRWERSAMGLEVGRDAVDLVFMDIELPGTNGMDAALELRRHDQLTPIIFVTNLAQYAVRGYQAEALDFIVKPFSYYDFALRMDRAMRVVGRRAGRRLTVKSRDGMRIFPASDLVRLEVSGHDVVYHLSDGLEFRSRGSLAQVEQGLGGSPFLRISSGCVVNMAHVRGVHDTEVHLSDGSHAWISRANKKRCLEAISRYLGGDL